MTRSKPSAVMFVAAVRTIPGTPVSGLVSTTGRDGNGSSKSMCCDVFSFATGWVVAYPVFT